MTLGRARARDVPVPGEGPRAARAGRAERERVAKDAPVLGGAVRRVLPAGAPGRGAARRAARRSSATCWRRRPMRPLELDRRGVPLVPRADHVRLARAAAGRHRRADRLGEVLDPRRRSSFALYGKTPAVEGATKSLIHQLLRPVARRAPVRGGRPGVARACGRCARKGASGHQLELLATDDAGRRRCSETVTRRARR